LLKRIPEINSASFSFLHNASQLIFGINYPEFHQQYGSARKNKSCKMTKNLQTALMNVPKATSWKVKRRLNQIGKKHPCIFLKK
jgi:hypothetical protein